jgi:cobalamin biosynthesis protein CbiD
MEKITTGPNLPEKMGAELRLSSLKAKLERLQNGTDIVNSMESAETVQERIEKIQSEIKELEG